MKNIKDKKLVILISIIIILILILFLIFYIMSTIQNKQDEIQNIEKIKSYTSISDFKTIEEVATYLECTYIKEEKSKDDNYKLDIYMKIKLQPYTEEKSNETFYNNLIGYSTYVLKFDNFRIIDKENNITIEVLCDKENEKLKTIIINGETDYFAK